MMPIASTFDTSSYESVPAMLTLPAKDALLVNVANPATVKSSNCVSPSTSKVPFASIPLLNVATPATLRSSNCVSPSTSKIPFISAPGS